MILGGRRIGVVILLVVAGCGDDQAGTASTTGSDPVGCGAGFAASDGQCLAVVPAEACAPGTAPVLGHDVCQPVGWNDCAAPFEPDPSGWGCRPILPTAPCPAGTRAELGNPACVAVGWHDCPDGFAEDESGWGCAPVVPVSPCTGPTRAAIGSETCVPVGNCDAAFPPAGATLFVDDTFTPAELDATHFASIGEAVAVAVDGDVIAIDEGTYAEGIAPTTAITLWGRCPELVVVDGAGVADPGLDVLIVDGVTLRGVTLQGHEFGVVARQGATVDVVDVVIDEVFNAGAIALFNTTSLTLTRTVIRGVEPLVAGDYGFGLDIEDGPTVSIVDSEITDSATMGVLAVDGATLEMERTIVQRSNTDGSQPFGHGVHVQDQSTATVRESLVSESRTLGVYVSGDGATADVTDSVVRETQLFANDFGYGVQVDAGGTLTLHRSALVQNRSIALFLFGATATATVSDSVLRDTRPNGVAMGRGLTTEDGADVTLQNTAIVDNREYGIAFGIAGTEVVVDRCLVAGTRRTPGGSYGWGINASDGAALTLTSSTIEDNNEYGVAVGKAGTVGQISGTLVRGTFRAPEVTLETSGYRVQGIGVQEGAALDLRDSALLDNQQVGLYVWDAIVPPVATQVVAENVVVGGTLPDASVGPGNAAGVLVGLGTHLELTRAAVTRNSTIGVLVMGAGAQATLADVVVTDTQFNNLGVFGRALGMQDGGSATVATSAFVGNREISLFVSTGSSVETNRLFVTGTLPDGAGFTGRGAEVQYGGQLTMNESAIVGGFEAGIFEIGAGSSVSLVQSMVGTTAVRPADGAFGHNIILSEGAHLSLERSRVYGAAAIGLAFSSSTAKILSSQIDQNLIAIHVQDGSSLLDGSGEPTAGQVLVSDDTLFLDNATRVGSGQVPLPGAGVASTP